jgi:hypothetical protein
MMTRTQISLELSMLRSARGRAGELGVSLAEYIRRLVARDLEGPPRSGDPSIVFNLGSSSGSDVGRDKDDMIAEAIASTRRPRKK